MSGRTGADVTFHDCHLRFEVPIRSASSFCTRRNRFAFNSIQTYPFASTQIIYSILAQKGIDPLKGTP
jgi:hypothetical protein